MSEYIHKSHNVTVLLYHLVFPAKYRRAVFDEQVDEVVREVCLEIEKRYEVKFIEIGVDKDHVHFLVQSVPTYSVTKLVKMIKSLTARGASEGWGSTGRISENRRGYKKGAPRGRTPIN